jgi:hypothetical protein
MSKKLLSVVLSFLFLLSTPFIASATNTDKLNSTTNSNVKTSLLRDTYLSDKEIFEITKSLEQSKDPSILSKYGIDGDDGVFLIYANQNDNSTISNDTTVSPNAILVGFGTLKCTASGMTQFATLNYRLYGDKMTYINATITYILKDPEIGDVWAGDILFYEIPSFSTIRTNMMKPKR